jgi:hypothetical protein
MNGLDARMRFGLVMFATLPGFLAITWFGAPTILEVLAPMAQAASRAVGQAQSLSVNPEGGWILMTDLVIESGPADMIGRNAGMVIGLDAMRNMLRALPILLALMLAPPYDWRLPARLALSLAGLMLIFIVSMLAIFQGDLAVLINNQTSLVDERMRPPDFTVYAPDMSAFEFFLASFGYYLATQVVPLLAPVVLWILCKPAAFSMLRAPRMP